MEMQSGVAVSKPKTQAQLDKATDQRLKKKYGVGLDWYNLQLSLQGGGCAICGSTPKTRALHIDHDHSYTKVKITSKKIGKTWGASGYVFGRRVCSDGNQEVQVVREVKGKLKVASVRGLLCFPHNTALRHFADNPEFLRSAADYLEAHQTPPEPNWCDSCDGTGLMEGWNKRDGYSCPKCKGEAVV